MVTANDCYKKYGDPVINEAKFMVMWDVPADIEIGVIPNKLYCNKDMIAPLTKAFTALVKTGKYQELKTWDGCFNIRLQRGSKTKMSLHCLPRDQQVWTKNGTISIQDIKQGTQVLTYNKETKQLEEQVVTNTFTNGVKNILEINIRNNKIKCSEEHEIMVLHKTPLTKSEFIQHTNSRGQQRALYQVQLVKAKNLVKGDKVLILKNASKLYNRDATNLVWFEILGLFIGDGCFHNRKNSIYNYVSFSIPKEDRVREHTKELLNAYFSVVKENDKAFFIYSKKDYELFRKYNFKAREKFIPLEVFNSSIEQKLAFIKGLLYSDGYTHKTYNKRNTNIFTLKYAIKTGSLQLLKDLKLLCATVGIKTSNIIVVHKEEERIIKGVKCTSHEAYSLTMTDYTNLIKLEDDAVYNDRQKNSTQFKTYSSHCYGYEHIGNEFTLETVNSIIPAGIEETYDIEVDNTHLFIVNGVVVSNSWGIAIDVNASDNQQGWPPKLSKEFVKCFTDAGFTWGGNFSKPDGMHMELTNI